MKGWLNLSLQTKKNSSTRARNFSENVITEAIFYKMIILLMTLDIKDETQNSKLLIIGYIHILRVFQDIFKLLVLLPSVV